MARVEATSAALALVGDASMASIATRMVEMMRVAIGREKR
jgi:hypothetical protein